MRRASFSSRQSPFYDDVRSEVNNYFTEKGISPTGDRRLYLKAIILLPSLALVYSALLWGNMPIWLAIIGAGVMGFVMALIGFNVMHDACHGSFSRRKSINEIFGYSMNLLGSNAFIWKVKHNRVHHTFTNIDGIDDDIMKVPVLRHCKSQPYKKIHRFQHIYGVFLYAISTILWVFVTDPQKYFGKNVSGTPLGEIPLKEHIIFWVTKILYVVVYMIIPIMVLGSGPFLIGYFVMNATLGLTLSVVFQLAHAVRITHFEDATKEVIKVDKEWAVHQIETTSDFAMKSHTANWLLGGLNFQVIHHLFPNVSHVHYKALQPIIADVCKKHGVDYRSYATFWEAVGSHFGYLRDLGKAA